MKNVIIVTRHPALVQYLREVGLADSSATVFEHVNAEEVRGEHVIGVLPMRLACECASVTEVPLDLPRELRGVDLTLDQVRRYAGQAVTYIVRTAAAFDAAERTAASGGDPFTISALREGRL